MPTDASAQHLATVLHSVVEAILAIDPAGRVTLLNPAAEKLFGVAQAQAIGQPLAALHASLGHWLERAAGDRRAEPLVFELTFEPERNFSVSLAPLREAGAPPVGWVVVLRDVTHLRRLEQWKSEAIQTAAHDLRNPLNLITGSVNLLRDLLPDPTPDQLECLTMIRAGADRMGALIDDLLNLEHIESGADVTMTKLPLHKVLQRVVEEFKLAADEKGIALAAEVPPAGGRVRGEESWLHRAVSNLVSNAVKYTPEGGRVVVRYREADRQGIVEVEDNGPGISPEAQVRLFERFYRVRGEATRRTPGTGLGLAIVKTIVEKHGGRVWVSSAEGKGSTFGFSVPLTGK